MQRFLTASAVALTLATSSSAYSVTVVGGTGFVGTRVCEGLVARGVSVTSVSKSGAVPKRCAGEPWVEQVTWNRADLATDGEDAIDAAVGKPDAMVSCVGAVGTDPDELLRANGVAVERAFASAKRSGSVRRTAVVSVASEVVACEESWLPEFFSGYFAGKRVAEAAANEVVANDDDDDDAACTIVRPTFIYGGDSFGLLPPRVNDAYGSGVEELLSIGIFKFLADVTPGLIKVALRPPSSVEAVAKACVLGVMGDIDGGVLDGTAEINDAVDQPEATGLTEALQWAKENIIKAVDFVKTKIEENQG